jgi:hypothetical protein
MFRRLIHLAVVVVATALTALTALTPAALAGTANAGLPGAKANPLAHMSWGVPSDDDLWAAYQSASGENHTLLGRLALRPRAIWLGTWNKVSQVKQATRQAVAGSQNRNPKALVQLATFELSPWEGQTAGGSWDVATDESWYRNLAAGIGNARALVVEQIDLPFTLKTSSREPERIDTYGAKVLSARRHTNVYLDAGTHGWWTPRQAARELVANGIRYARGFSLDDTDYDSTAVELKFGAQVIAALARDGVHGKHFIVNTDENGQPYTAKQASGSGSNINSTPMCHGTVQTVCQRTGIPPTTNVTAARWHLGRSAAKLAKKDCDGYVWVGRPWNINGGPFDTQNALWLAANGKY